MITSARRTLQYPQQHRHRTRPPESSGLGCARPVNVLLTVWGGAHWAWIFKSERSDWAWVGLAVTLAVAFIRWGRAEAQKKFHHGEHQEAEPSS